MKKIFLLRHAKAEKSSPNGSDYDRALSQRGHENARHMAQWLGHSTLRPDSVLCSSATRTTQTYEEFQHILPFLPKAHFLPSLYLASAGDLLHEINNLADTSHHILLIGHNPGIKELCVQLANDDRPHIIDAIALSFPTSALAAFEFPVNHWRDIVPASGNLIEYMHPDRLPKISI